MIFRAISQAIKCIWYKMSWTGHLKRISAVRFGCFNQRWPRKIWLITGEHNKMNFFKKILNFKNKVLPQKNRKPLSEIISPLIIRRMEELLNDPKSRPEHISEKEWRSILQSIKSTISQQESKTFLKSLGKRRIRQLQAEKAMINFLRHYKHL